MKSHRFLFLFLLMIGSFSLKAQSTVGLVGHWSFDGNADDQTTNVNHGTVVGATLVDDRFGNPQMAYHFDGSSWIEIGNVAALNFGTSDFTISFWFKSTAGGPVSFMSKQLSSGTGGWNMWMDNGNARLITGTATAYSIVNNPTTLYTDVWRHVVLVRKGVVAADWEVYVDGVETSQPLFSNAALDVSTTATAYIGRRESGNHLIGTLDDFYVYDRALSQAEVDELFNAPNPVTPPSNNTGAFDELAINTPEVPTGYKLAVDGAIISEKMRVQLDENWPDYVFKPGYALMSLEELEAYIEKHGHLPAVMPAATAEAEGVELGSIASTLLLKIEELTLYTISQQKLLLQYQEIMDRQSEKLRALETQLKELKEKE